MTPATVFASHCETFSGIPPIFPAAYTPPFPAICLTPNGLSAEPVLLSCWQKPGITGNHTIIMTAAPLFSIKTGFRCYMILARGSITRNISARNATPCLFRHPEAIMSPLSVIPCSPSEHNTPPIIPPHPLTAMKIYLKWNCHIAILSPGFPPLPVPSYI